MTHSLLVFAACLSLTACCTSAACRPENLPFRGEVFVSDDGSHHERLFALLQYAARNDCCEVLYRHLSHATREEYGETTFCLFWESLEVPEPYEYKLADVVRRGEFAGVVPGPREGEEFAYVSYPPDGEPGDNLLAQILLVVEADERGRRVQRLALLEQYQAIERGDIRYWWDAGR
ncbi:MAG: hypothetical protein D6731_16245 [Planctomycetota bacterium]|nr:MAG: hypothetical protein D6731_16245 [Planctomycetota bacterium]